MVAASRTSHYVAPQLSLRRRPIYDFNYCLMSLFLFCLFGTRFSIFPYPFVRICSYKYEVLQRSSSHGNRYVCRVLAVCLRYLNSTLLRITRIELNTTLRRLSISLLERLQNAESEWMFFV